MDAIPISDFNTLGCAQNTYFSRPFLSAFESSNPRINFHYVVVYMDDRAVGLGSIQVITISADVILKNIRIGKWIKGLLRSVFKRSHIHMMFCGNIFLSGEHGIWISKDADSKAVIDTLARAIDDLAFQLRPLHAIFIKDFEVSRRKITERFEKHHYTPLNVEPNLIITLDPHWHSFQDYKTALKSKYRVKVNRADTMSQSLDAKILDETDLETYKFQLQGLYENTIANANFNAQVLNLDTYTRLRSEYRDHFIVKAYFLDNELVGFLSALDTNGHLDAHFIGLNYDLNRTHAIYPRILNDYIRLGIEKGSSHINLGRTASEIKTTIGAVPTDLICYIKHRRKWINTLLKPFVKRVQLKRFKAHEPFKK